MITKSDWNVFLLNDCCLYSLKYSNLYFLTAMNLHVFLNDSPYDMTSFLKQPRAIDNFGFLQFSNKIESFYYNKTDCFR